MLQLTFVDGRAALTFIFLSPAGKDRQLSERNSVKELLLQLLPAARAKAPAVAAATSAAQVCWVDSTSSGLTLCLRWVCCEFSHLGPS